MVDESEIEAATGSGVAENISKGVKVVGVNHFSQYKGCVNCSSKVEEDYEDCELGKCTNCKMVQCMKATKCDVSAQLLLKCSDGSVFNLRAFNKMILIIANAKDDKCITPKTLLKAHAFNIHYVNGIIQSISRSIAQK